jgi:hypothetical protein
MAAIAAAGLFLEIDIGERAWPPRSLTDCVMARRFSAFEMRLLENSKQRD